MTTWWRPFGKSAPPLLYVANRNSDLPLGALNAQVWGASVAGSTTELSHAGALGFSSSATATVQAGLSLEHTGSIGFSSAASAVLGDDLVHSGALGLASSATATLERNAQHAGTLGFTSSASVVLGDDLVHAGVLGFSSLATVDVSGNKTAQHSGFLGFASVAEVEIQTSNSQGIDGGGYEISADRWNKTIPEFLRRRYEKETPQAQTAKRIARALNKASIEKVAQQAREGGVEAVTLSHTLYFSYIAHLLRSWDVPSLNGLSAALLTQISDASSQRQMIQAAQALLREIDEQDEELLLTSIL
jgi:hypothetical protein